MHELVWKHLRQFAEQLVDGGIDRCIGRVQDRWVWPELVGGRHGHSARPPLGMGAKPTGHMAGHVEFRHHSDAAFTGFSHEPAQLIRSVALLAGQLGVGGALKTEALVVGEVQMQHVQLVEGHAVQGAEQGLQGDETARRVQHQPAPREGRRIVDLRNGQMPVLTG